jgi:hypothetical protein
LKSFTHLLCLLLLNGKYIIGTDLIALSASDTGFFIDSDDLVSFFVDLSERLNGFHRTYPYTQAAALA